MAFFSHFTFITAPHVLHRVTWVGGCKRPGVLSRCWWKPGTSYCVIDDWSLRTSNSNKPLIKDQSFMAVSVISKRPRCSCFVCGICRSFRFSKSPILFNQASEYLMNRSTLDPIVATPDRDNVYVPSTHYRSNTWHRLYVWACVYWSERSNNIRHTADWRDKQDERKQINHLRWFVHFLMVSFLLVCHVNLCSAVFRYFFKMR